MSKIKGKGTILKATISNVLTAISQVIDITLPEMETETSETDTLDNSSAGIPYEPTGRTEGGSLSGNMFLDYSLPIHYELFDILKTPASTVYNLVFADTGATTWPFTGAGLKLGGSIGLKELNKSSFSIKLSGLPTFPS